MFIYIFIALMFLNAQEIDDFNNYNNSEKNEIECKCQELFQLPIENDKMYFVNEVLVDFKPFHKTLENFNPFKAFIACAKSKSQGDNHMFCTNIPDLVLDRYNIEELNELKEHVDLVKKKWRDVSAIRGICVEAKNKLNKIIKETKKSE